MNESAPTSDSDNPQKKRPDTGQNDGDPTPMSANHSAEIPAFLQEDDEPLILNDTEELPPLPPAEKTGIVTGIAIGLPKSDAVIRYVKRCDVGARERNEDSCLAFSSEIGGHFTMMPFGLYIVADGMGGHINGHVASKIASRVAANHILKEIYLPLLVHDSPPQVSIRDALVDAVQLANTAVFENEPEIDSGTTLTVALLLGSRLYVAHVGDSRLYLHTEDKFEAVTNDHSLVQRLQDVGSLTAEEATVYRYRHVLLRAVGQGSEVEIDTYMRLLPKKGKLLLCSDGLCGFVSDDILKSKLNQPVSLEKMAEELYNTAIDANSNDNITVILVDFSL